MSTVASSSRRTSADDRLDLVFHALADRTRRELIRRLAANGPAKITDLAEPFKMSLPAVSKHLRVLESARLINRAVDGRIHRCTFVPEPLAQAENWLDGYRSFWEGALDALANYVEQPKQRRHRIRKSL
jgi:DNA-binding transcriptional ArsR family regulator